MINVLKCQTIQYMTVGYVWHYFLVVCIKFLESPRKVKFIFLALFNSKATQYFTQLEKLILREYKAYTKAKEQQKENKKRGKGKL